MRALRSLRSRLFFAAVLWTTGLSAAVVLISTQIMLRYRNFGMVLHGPAIYHGRLLTIFAIVCMVAGLWQVRRGVAPLNQLRERLLAVRDGRERRVQGGYPVEVQPLVDDLNTLLDHRERTVARALAKAGDLAHGLKTPLAVLSQQADRAEADGRRDLAETIGQQVDRMLRQVEYHLAHARAAASGATPGARCSVRESTEALARTLKQLHAGRGVSIDLDVAAEHVVRGQREDLDEMLGNLLDNACTWARSRVMVASSENQGTVTITVDDDGPGLAPSMREVVLQRGVRADEAAPGSGFGLAIVRDLVDLYGGSIALTDAQLGGLRARLQLPSVTAGDLEGRG
jgi:signal transduction histidine kinase